MCFYDFVFFLRLFLPYLWKRIQLLFLFIGRFLKDLFQKKKRNKLLRKYVYINMREMPQIKYFTQLKLLYIPYMYAINTRFLLLLWVFFKRVFLAFVMSTLFVSFFFFVFRLPGLRQAAAWVVIGLLVFWLMSGFNHFLKKYRFGKYTTAMQRFWKRALSCFWIIEGFLFSIFLYLILNASCEPKFWVDHVVDEKLHLPPATQFLLNSFCIVVLINVSVYLTVLTKFKTLRQLLPYLLAITFLLAYIFLKEAYQMYFIVTWYEDFFWSLSETTNTWELEKDIPRMRDRNHFVTLLVVAKFWHYVFVFVSWVFFLTKSIEQKRVRYALLAMSFQNFILFYSINWVCAYSWGKWFFRRFGDQTYFWFFSSIRVEHFFVIVSEIVNLISSIPDYVTLSICKSDLSVNHLHYLILPSGVGHEVHLTNSTNFYKLFKSKLV